MMGQWLGHGGVGLGLKNESGEKRPGLAAMYREEDGETRHQGGIHRMWSVSSILLLPEGR
jgi:hypothetical protein